MDVDEFTKHQREHLDQLAKEFDSVCEQHLKQIHERLCNEHPPYPPPHTVTLARAVHVLAFRALADTHPAKRPGSVGYTSKGRYGLHRYWVTVFRLNDGINQAAQTGALRLRDSLTGLPIQEWHSPSKDELVEWEKCVIFPTNDRQAAERRALEIMITTNWHLLAPHFDTGIVASLTEIDAWAAGIGVATNGEVSELLQASEAQTAKRVRITAAAIAAEERGEKFDLAKFETEDKENTAPAQTAATPAPVVPDDVDFTMLATRTQLIDVFGKFTGMDKSWFDNLTDTPKLMAARKFKGQSGRKNAEPLFCPYEVMQWLADPKQKKCTPLSEATAWRLLKNQFPKVYNRYSIVDPNAD